MFDSKRARRALLGLGLSHCARHAASCTVALLAIAICALLAAVPTARAGRYHVYGCRMPNEVAAPIDGWTSNTTPIKATVIASDTCQTGGGLVAALADGVEHEVNSSSTWTFSAPPVETIVGATLWRAGDTDGGSVANAYYEFWIAGPEDLDRQPYVFDECVASFSCPLGGIGDSQEVRSVKNVVIVPRENLGTHIFINASCAGQSGFSCPEGKKDPNGYAAVVYLYAADLILEQTAQPFVVTGSVGGELASAPKLSGTATVTFEAGDVGAGVYQAVVEVDERAVGATVLDGNGGRCADVGQTSDGLPAFLYLQPCAPAVSADVPLDTTSLSNGLHRIVVRVTDAAGNSAVVMDRRVEVANATSGAGSASSSAGSSAAGSAAGTGGGGSSSLAGGQVTANGSPASARALLRLRWRSSVKPTLVSRWGRPAAIAGRLTTASGDPIAGASLEVLATPAVQGARAKTIATVRTGADGRFGVGLAGHAVSEQVVVAYRAHLGDLAPAAVGTLRLRIPASLTLSVYPHVSHAGGTIRFTGVVHGGPMPATGKQIVLQAHAPGSAWRTFEALTTDRNGRYRASYRFRLAGPITYRFRAVSRQEADFPFATGESNLVSVWER